MVDVEHLGESDIEAGKATIIEIEKEITSIVKSLQNCKLESGGCIEVRVY